MNRYFRLFIVGLLTVSIASCSSHKHAEHDHDSGGKSKSWKALDDFHSVMAKVFHPYMDSNDLKPIKSLYAELVAASGKLSKSPIPEGVDSSKAKVLIQNLNNDVTALAEHVKQGRDEDIGASLTKAHDDFHKVMELAEE